MSCCNSCGRGCMLCRWTLMSSSATLCPWVTTCTARTGPRWYHHPVQQIQACRTRRSRQSRQHKSLSHTVAAMVAG